VRILASVNHPNVIGYKEAFFDDSTNHLCIVMENADGGDMLYQIKQKKDRKETIGEQTIWHYLI
jgi:NIMA (never in mitosis gene a)-related kinase 1/4/5